ncbi:hypothetical protein GCM10010344_56070 [Streptomyces bluensis]|nr:hypothetical protein GCM10010344_56070 [Streptomyces bluensis]
MYATAVTFVSGRSRTSADASDGLSDGASDRVSHPRMRTSSSHPLCPCVMASPRRASAKTLPALRAVAENGEKIFERLSA